MRGGSVVRTLSSLADALEGKVLEYVDEHKDMNNLKDDNDEVFDAGKEVRSFSQKSNDEFGNRGTSQPLRETEEVPGFLDCSGNNTRHLRVPRAAKDLLIFLSSSTVWSNEDSNEPIDLIELCEENALTRQAAARCFYVLILQSEAFIDAFKDDEGSSITLVKGEKYRDGLLNLLA